jgi:hypothetical protein
MAALVPSTSTARLRSALARVYAPAGVVLLAVLLRVVYGPAHPGYDAAWALLWGDQAWSGQLPDFQAEVAPTPHPLANAVALMLAPFGTEAAATATGGLAWLAFAALAWVTYRLGSLLFGPLAGGVAAIIVLTRPLLVVETQQAILDVPFLALIAGAAVIELQRRGEDLRVPVLLALAGMLRPEGWIVGAAWWLWSLRGSSRGAAIRAAAIIACGPLAWSLADLLVTGDPMWSLHGTQDLAAQLERPRSLGTALVLAPDHLRHALLDPVVWIGFAGAAAALVWRFERALLPAATIGVGLLTFLALGVTGLPLLARYLLLPALMLAVFAGAALAGWRTLEKTDPGRRPWIAGAALFAVWFVALIPHQANELTGTVDFARERTAVQADLRSVLNEPAVQRAAASCPTIWVPDHRPRAVVATILSRRPADVRLAGGDRPRDGLYLNYTNRAAASAYAVRTGAPALWPGQLPPGARKVASGRSWVAGVRCRTPAPSSVR